MALILLATIVDGMDSSIVNVVLPAISEDLGMSVSASALVSVAYLVPIAGLCLAFSKLDIYANMTIRFFVGQKNQRLNISRLPLYIQIVAQLSIVQILFS